MEGRNEAERASVVGRRRAAQPEAVEVPAKTHEACFGLIQHGAAVHSRPLVQACSLPISTAGPCALGFAAAGDGSMDVVSNRMERFEHCAEIMVVSGTGTNARKALAQVLGGQN